MYIDIQTKKSLIKVQLLENIKKTILKFLIKPAKNKSSPKTKIFLIIKCLTMIKEMLKTVLRFLRRLY
jgi:hypothetical protein